ncbi:MAG: DNA repair protein RecO [Oscillospiraceae bacterium]|nr:DNA repair protein RecO [Oscillospiraceae bacterium]
MYRNTRGLVLRETIYRETSKILTVLTADEGKLTVSAKGARRRGSKLAPAAQLLTFSDMTLSGTRDRWTLTEAAPIEMFEGLREDLELMALGSYFAQLLEAVSDEDLPNPAILALGLNALYLLSRGKGDSRMVKAAFEMRLMTLAGFAPSLEACRVCGRTDPQAPRLELTGGTVRCRDCRDGDTREETAPLCEGSLAALRHITSCPDKKVFSFALGAEAASRLEEAAERYTLIQMDRGFSTLDYYRNCRL